MALAESCNNQLLGTTTRWLRTRPGEKCYNLTGDERIKGALFTSGDELEFSSSERDDELPPGGMRRLSPAERLACARHAAVLWGRPAPLATLIRRTGTTERRLARCLTELLSRQLERSPIYATLPSTRCRTCDRHGRYSSE